MDEHHQLPSFTYEQETWVEEAPLAAKEKSSPFVLPKGKEKEKQHSNAYVPPTLIQDRIARESLPVPRYQKGETISFLWIGDTVWTGSIILIRMQGQSYWVIEGEDPEDASVRASRAWWRHKCYDVDSIEYHVQMSDCIPRIRGRSILSSNKHRSLPERFPVSLSP